MSPRYGGDDVAAVLIGGYEFVGQTLDLNITQEAILEESHTLGDAWVERSAVGLRRTQMEINGYYEDTTGSILQAFQTGLGAATGGPMCILLEGTATGAGFIGWEGAEEAQYQPIANRGELTKLRATFQGGGAFDFGDVTRMWGQTTTSGQTTGTAVDGAASSTGGVAYLQIGNTTQISDMALSIMHSSDNVTWAALINFATGIVAHSAQRIVTTAVVERYIAARWNFVGASANREFEFFVGFSRNAPAS